MITELDVEVLPRAASGADISARERAANMNPFPHGLSPELAGQQADFYRRIFAVVSKHPGVVTRVTFWGSHDGTSWLNDWPVPGRMNHPLLWDRQLQPKPAFAAVLQALCAKPGGATGASGQ
jgi:endo-1,4-beta-xylanase